MAVQSKPPPPTPQPPPPERAPLPAHYRRVLRHLNRMDRRTLIDQILEQGKGLPAWVRQALEEPGTGDARVLGLFHLRRRVADGDMEPIEPAVLIEVERHALSRSRQERRAIVQCYWPEGGRLRVAVREAQGPDWSLFAGRRGGLPGLVNGEAGQSFPTSPTS